MSVQKRTTKRPDGKIRTTSWRVRWKEGKHWKSRTFDSKADADTFDRELKRRQKLGTLALIDVGSETLDTYVTETWTPAHLSQLAPKTRAIYATIYDHHVSPTLGGVPLREINAEMIGLWQAARLKAGAGPSAVRKALALLGSILQRAAESGRIPTNPARLVRKAQLPRSAEVRPLAPITVERMRAASSARDATLLSVLAYAGLRPGEALALRWSDVRERTILVERAISLGVEKDTKTAAHRTVRLLAPLAQDLREWRMASGRPAEDELIFPGRDGQPWSESAYKSWRRRAFARSLAAAGVNHARPYDLRHSFASLLLHEGRNVIDVARQLGHGPQLTLGRYGHVIDELSDAPRQDAETSISAARVSTPQQPAISA